MLRTAGLLLILQLCQSLVRSAIPDFRGPPIYDLVISNKILGPDGFNRSTVLAGGKFPGPTISGIKGQRFRVNVVNELTDPTMVRATSIHWHGIFQQQSSWADGAAFVNQCPISPANSFLYDFTTPNNAGTYWYHSHISTQYCDGLRGPLVIYDPLDPQKFLYDIDDESTILTLADWYHDPAPQILTTARPSATLINGVGRYTGGPSIPLAVINVKAGLRYRFRIVSISCYSRFNFSIAGHKLTIIESDGVNTHPLTVDTISIFAGQRYSVVLNANKPVGNYWITADTDRGDGGFSGGINSAILRYKGAPAAEPKVVAIQPPALRPLQETDIRPLANLPVPGHPHVGGADVAINLELGIDLVAFRALVNGVTFEPPTVPVLLQMLSGAHSAQDLYPAGSIYALPRNKVIEVSIPGGLIDGPHPFHLHGHNFHVVRSAGSSVYNFVNPVIRDVVSIGETGDNVTIRFVTNNPGPWFLHCHLDWHLELGLAIVFAEDLPDVQKQPVPKAWSQLCPIYDALKANLTITLPPST